MMRIPKSIIVMTLLFTLVVILQATSVVSEASSLEKPITKSPLPGYPLIAKPGSSCIVELKQDIAEEVGSAYLGKVSLIDNTKLVREEYMLKYKVLSETKLELLVPEYVEPGVYDLILTVGDANYTIPNTVWVLDHLSQTLTIMHQSDDHAMGGKDLRVSAGILAQLLGVDVVLDTGDVTDKASAIEATDYVDTVISYYGYTPLFVAPGNHDTGSSAFEEYIAPRIWFKCIDWLFLATLDTGEKAHPSKEQLEFLREALKTSSNVSVRIVMFHHPTFWYWGRLETNFQDKDLTKYLSDYWRPALDVAREFLELVEDYNVTIVLAGHIHRDMLTQYYSTRTGAATLFLTTTTLSGSRPYCNGFHIITLKKNGNYSLLFMNNSRDKCNSIPVDKSLEKHFYVRPIISGSAIGLIIHNKLDLELNGTVVLRIPWTGDKTGFSIFNTTILYGTPTAALLDYMPYKDRMVIALGLSLPSYSGLKVVLATKPDKTPPSITISRMFPAKPLYGSPLTIYLEVKDDGWGVEGINLSIETISGKPINYSLKSIGDNLIVVIPSVTESFKIKVQATDLAGNTRSSQLSINVAKATTQTTPETTTGKTTTTTTAPQPAKTDYTRYILVAIIITVIAVLFVMVFKRT